MLLPWHVRTILECATRLQQISHHQVQPLHLVR